MRSISIAIVLLILAAVACGSPADSGGAASTVQSPGTSTSQAKPAAVWEPDGIITAGEYSGSQTYGSYTLNWRHDGQHVYIGLTARTSGWVAVAVQPGSRMKNADMVLGMVRDGKTEIQDLFSTGDFGPHLPDSELGGTQDILAFGGKEDGGSTTIEFKRPLATADKYDIPLTRGANKIIWAYGSGDNADLKHFSKGYGELNLP